MTNYFLQLIDEARPTGQSISEHFLNPKKIIFQPDQVELDIDIQRLVYQIRLKPKDLLLHLQRIFTCYLLDDSIKLQAALIDLFAVLEQKGRDLARRMLESCREKLADRDYEQLYAYLSTITQTLPKNKFTVIQRDLVGTSLLIKKNETVECDKPNKLQLARDFIEYSQLDEAIALLEQIVMEASCDREAQELLLELYQDTEKQRRFEETHCKAVQARLELIPEWEVLHDYFANTVP